MLRKRCDALFCSAVLDRGKCNVPFTGEGRDRMLLQQDMTCIVRKSASTPAPLPPLPFPCAAGCRVTSALMNISTLWTNTADGRRWHII